MAKKRFECDESKKDQSTTEKISGKSLEKNVFSPTFAWFWLITIFTIITAIMIFVIPEGFYPLSYVRLIFGATFILFVPGFCLIKLLFPEKLPFKSSFERLDKVERFVLSIGTSITLVPMVGLLLNYTNWGIHLIPLTLSLVVLTLSFALVAFIREYNF